MNMSTETKKISSARRAYLTCGWCFLAFFVLIATLMGSNISLDLLVPIFFAGFVVLSALIVYSKSKAAKAGLPMTSDTIYPEFRHDETIYDHMRHVDVDQYNYWSPPSHRR